MKTIATIKTNDETSNRRVYLCVIRRDPSADGSFGIFTRSGEDAGLYRWKTRQEAIDAIGLMWSDPAWDLQYKN